MLKRSGPIENIVIDGGYTQILRTIGVIGDSLSSGEHVSYTKDKGMGWHDYCDVSWGQFMARKTGTKVYNFSKGGLMAKTFFTDYLELVDKKVFSKEKLCQAYIIALGVNDLNRLNEYELGFGSFSDIDFNNFNNNKDSFIGWYTKIIQTIKYYQPKARIFLVTTPNELYNHDINRKNLRDFIIKISECFEFTYYLNLYDYLIYDDEYLNNYMMDYHLTSMGYKDSADIIATYIDYIIKNNPRDFLQLEFIDKDVYNEKYRW